MRIDQIPLALWNIVFFKERVIWESLYSVEESATRLATAVKPSGFLRIFNKPYIETVVGRVSVDKVLLYKSTPTLENAFQPIFRGRFVEREGRTTLEGFFSLARDVRAFMLVWFSFPIVGIFVAAFLESQRRFQRGAPVLDALSPLALGLLGSIAWVIFGAVVTTLFKMCSNEDSNFIVEFVRMVFKNNGDHE